MTQRRQIVAPSQPNRQDLEIEFGGNLQHFDRARALLTHKDRTLAPRFSAGAHYDDRRCAEALPTRQRSEPWRE